MTRHDAMTEQTQRWTIGDVRITSIVEAQTDGIPPSFFFPDATEEVVKRHAWLHPHFAHSDGRVHLRVQAFVIEVGGRTVVVDPCVGNGKKRLQPFWNDQSWPFMERFVAAGFDPTAVDLVVHTHLHVDHVGWDTHLEAGRWRPTFSNARHVYVRQELEWNASDPDPETSQIRADSIAPVLDAGLADIVDPDADLGGGLRLAPTAGHTPGHASLWVDSHGQRALLTGDVIHHPVQCAEPTIGFVSDADAEQARITRRALLAEAAGADALVFGAHFPTTPGGRITVDGAAWRFQAQAGRPG